MKKTLTFVLLNLVLGVTISTPALAGWWRGPASGPGNCGGPCASQVQDVGLDKSRQDFHAQSLELRQQLHDQKAAYRELMGQEAPDKEAAAKLWSEIFDLQTRLRQMATAAGLPGDWRPGRNGVDAAHGYGCGNGPRGNGGRGCGGPRSGC